MSQQQSLPDSLEELVRQAQRASADERREILDHLVNQFAEAAFRWAVMVLEDSNAASDALQEAWLTAYLHLDQLHEGAAFPGWFRQIVLTACYQAIRHEKRTKTLPDEAKEDIPDPSDPVRGLEQQERLEHIREAVLALPERERVVTELYYFADYPQQEIAEVLAVPLTTVKKRLQYARERLKGLIHIDMVSQLDLYALNGGCTAAAFSNLTEAAANTTVIEWASVTSTPILVGSLTSK